MTTWDEHHRAGATIATEAAGWANSIDTSDEADLLAWAREYLPRFVAWAATAPGGES